MSAATLSLVRQEDSAVVNVFGATVTSWKVGGEEMLFLSQRSHLDGTKPIRGGIPIVFPHFGPWESRPRHGFARLHPWTIEEAPHKNADGDAEVLLSLQHSPTTRSIWDYRFAARYRVTLKKNELLLGLEIANEDDTPFEFTTLLHTYFKVPDVSKSTLSGCKGCSYLDKVRNLPSCQEQREHIVVSGPIDNVYAKTQDTLVLTNAAGGKTVRVSKKNLPDTVVWNPWAEGAKQMEDFGDDEYTKMLCVEAGYVAEPVRLPPRDVFRASCSLQAS